jgi:hypothetical protein
MAKYKSKANGSIVLEAVQFNPGIQPWPERVKPWGEIVPRDMSFGYLDVPSRTHVFALDWIAEDDEGIIHVYRDAVFRANFEPYAEQFDAVAHPQPELELIDRVTKLQVACSEENIRRIVREEIEKWWKQQMTWLRAQTGMGHEVK